MRTPVAATAARCATNELHTHHWNNMLVSPEGDAQFIQVFHILVLPLIWQSTFERKKSENCDR